MRKFIFETLTVPALAATLSACAGLPSLDGDVDRSTDAPGKTIDASYVDYWQTRNPADYRPQVSSATRAASTQPVAPSPDVKIAQPSLPAAPAQRNSEPRIVAVIPVSGKSTLPSTGVGTLAPGKAVAAPTTSPVPSAKTAKSQRIAASGRAKAKRNASPPISKDLWGRMRGRLALVNVEHPRITERIDYLKRNPGYLNLFVQRAQPYLYYIVEHIDRRELPMDLALVPMVESAFEPTAVSPKDAAGLWQIIPTTGEEWGLMLAEGYDGRLDIHTSTEVALRYLRYLNKRFNGDWLLALAAYNAGPRAVQDAINAYTATPRLTTPLVETHPAIVRLVPAPAPLPPESLFWSLKLPQETQDYVPRIVALAQVIADPNRNGVKLQAIANQPYLYRVDFTPEIKVLDSVVAAGIPAEEFSRFNPGFKPGVEPPVRAYNVLLPREQAQTLATAAPGARLIAPSKYTVQKGETLDLIAKRHGVPSQQLAQWNGLNVKRALKAGQQLTIYPSS